MAKDTLLCTPITSIPKRVYIHPSKFNFSSASPFKSVQYPPHLGSCGIILMAPSLYDMREPIDAKHTTIGVN